MVTRVPARPLVGVKPVIRGLTTKALALVAVPAGVVTEMAPVIPAAGTVAVMADAEFTTYVAGRPLKVTAVAPVNAEPEIWTTVPTSPLVGEKPPIVA